ncbi:hypothetical protein MferCBS31731_005467 [Microsporum ferrugineum]
MDIWNGSTPFGWSVQSVKGPPSARIPRGRPPSTYPLARQLIALLAKCGRDASVFEDVVRFALIGEKDTWIIGELGEDPPESLSSTGLIRLDLTGREADYPSSWYTVPLIVKIAGPARPLPFFETLHDLFEARYPRTIAIISRAARVSDDFV